MKWIIRETIWVLKLFAEIVFNNRQELVVIYIGLIILSALSIPYMIHIGMAWPLTCVYVYFAGDIVICLFSLVKVIGYIRNNPKK